VALDPQGLAAFIEILTVGQVSKRPAEPRVPTQTDAALVAPMVDLLLAELSQSLKPAMENLLDS
jgi:flagellar motor switch protein FliM